MQQILQLRWKFLHDISILRARLFEDVDHKLESYKSSVAKFALDSNDASV